ncbi:hypothetical protein KM043_006779 [Ampulex compressa]|nr:hypothetical protein KM043_006779 [Ampulex compressa]
MRSVRGVNSVLLLLKFVLVLDLVLAKGEYTKLFERCTTEKNAFDCLKRRALEILDAAIQDDKVYVINDYLAVGKDPAALERSTVASRSLENDTALSLDQKLDNKFYEYLSSRSLQLTIPGNAFEGRKRKGKGYGGLVLGAIAIAGMMAQLAYSKIAFLAGSALLTAKIALVMSAIIGLKKLVSSSGGGGHEVIYATASEHHGGYGGGGGGGGYSGGWQRALDGVPPT